MPFLQQHFLKCLSSELPTEMTKRLTKKPLIKNVDFIVQHRKITKEENNKGKRKKNIFGSFNLFV